MGNEAGGIQLENVASQVYRGGENPMCALTSEALYHRTTPWE